MQFEAVAMADTILDRIRENETFRDTVFVDNPDAPIHISLQDELLEYFRIEYTSKRISSFSQREYVWRKGGKPDGFLVLSSKRILFRLIDWSGFDFVYYQFKPADVIYVAVSDDGVYFNVKDSVHRELSGARVPTRHALKLYESEQTFVEKLQFLTREFSEQFPMKIEDKRTHIKTFPPPPSGFWQRLFSDR